MGLRKRFFTEEPFNLSLITKVYTFYIKQNVGNNQTLFHEIGHNIQTKFKIKDSDWKQVKDSDGNSMSSYGDATEGEDLAEAFAKFAQAKLNKDSLKELEDFKKEYPNRYEVLNKIWNNQYNSGFMSWLF